MGEELNIIVNPTAGGKVRKALDAMTHACQAEGRSFRVHKSTCKGNVTALCQMLAEQNTERVVILGGDGTLREAVQALHHTDTAMAVIPCGTGNDWVKAAGIPANLIEAANVALHGRRDAVDLLDMEGYMVCNYVGAGMDCITRRYAEKSMFSGKLAYLSGLIQALLHLQSMRYTITLPDGTRIEGESVLIGMGNGTCIGGGIPAFPMADLRDGVMDVLVAKKLNRRQVLPVLPRLLNGTHEHLSCVEFYHVPAIEFTFDAPTPASADGEIMEKRSLCVTLQPQALQVIVP